jgi:serine/threonine protein kinase
MVDVAVKTLKEGSGEEDRVKFLQEAAIMGQFKHPYVVEMYGMIITSEPVSMDGRVRGRSNPSPSIIMYPCDNHDVEHLIP